MSLRVQTEDEPQAECQEEGKGGELLKLRWTWEKNRIKQGLGNKKITDKAALDLKSKSGILTQSKERCLTLHTAAI